MIRSASIQWLAGFLEGEGSFCYVEGPRVCFKSTDRDVVEKAATLLGAGISGPVVRVPGYKPIYNVGVYGHVAIGWMMTLFGLMGDRRRGQISATLARWRAGRSSDGIPPICHPDRPLRGNGLCDLCYQRKRYHARKLEAAGG